MGNLSGESRERNRKDKATRYLSVTYARQLQNYLTIIPRARMGSESIVHEAEGRMGY